MSKAVEDVAHFSKEGEDHKLVKGMEHTKVCHFLSYIYHCNKNLIQPKLDCSSCIHPLALTTSCILSQKEKPKILG